MSWLLKTFREMRGMRARPIGAFLLAAITGLLVISLSLLQTPLSRTMLVQAQTRKPGFVFNEFLIETPHFYTAFSSSGWLAPY